MRASTGTSSFIVVLAALLSLCGCGNALFFYETGKLSMTLEGKPDSSQPIQGSVGFKERTVVVAPPITEHDPITNKDRQTDSSAMIASFNVNKEPGWGPITLDTTLITGRATICLDETQTVAAAQAVAGTFNDDPAAKSSRDTIRAWIKGNATNRKALKDYLTNKKLISGSESEGNWLFEAPASQLQTAITDLSIPS